ncbi:hypothetical protein CRUP_017667 [Coryphaenoides rupestris]|nr:hypothetical protein CRUP_017667 [Coryphaenoides rupestris]
MLDLWQLDWKNVNLAVTLGSWAAALHPLVSFSQETSWSNLSLASVARIFLLACPPCKASMVIFR